MTLNQDDLDYFDRGKTNNPKFWSRLGGEPNFKDTKVLDVGCGFGSLCIDIAKSGAGKVIGIDINEKFLDFAEENMIKNHPKAKKNVEFICCQISELKEKNFDYIISQNSFEHILNLDEVFSGMESKLKSGGKIYIGFSALYNSPLGHHNLIGTKFPWAHVLFSEETLVKKANKNRTDKISSIQDLGLNQLSYAKYKSLLFNSNLKVIYFNVNVSKNPILKIFSIISRIRSLEEYFTYNLYCILEKI
ncbi:MAG: class I SAM-dependent methyltransferase [Thermoplasmata archaeon]|nr:MAG: class I SAM-dependent methyltransferase [Thermoplasmata archaeon]